MTRNQRIGIACALWVAICGGLVVALDNAPDPSRRRDRILSNDAGRIAVAEMRRRDAARFRDYEAVHVANAPRSGGRSEAKWIVLVDRVPHTGLRDAFIVELRASDGAVLGVRKAEAK
jgi:hypothetical protein